MSYSTRRLSVTDQRCSGSLTHCVISTPTDSSLLAATTTPTAATTTHYYYYYYYYYYLHHHYYSYSYTACRYESPPAFYDHVDHFVNNNACYAAVAWPGPRAHDHYASVYDNISAFDDDELCDERFSTSGADYYSPFDDVTYYFRWRRCSASYDNASMKFYCCADAADAKSALVEAWTPPQHENCRWTISDDRYRTFNTNQKCLFDESWDGNEEMEESGYSPVGPWMSRRDSSRTGLEHAEMLSTAGKSCMNGCVETLEAEPPHALSVSENENKLTAKSVELFKWMTTKRGSSKYAHTGLYRKARTERCN